VSCSQTCYNRKVISGNYSRAGARIYQGNRDHLNTSGLRFKNVCIFNVVPPVQRHNTGENPEYPYLGSDEDRKEYVLYFNSLLKSHCSSKQFVYFDVYEKYRDINGFLRKDLSDGNVHIREISE
jgi:hypothetical protein